ncbi:uncharacterized protein HMPREF1541_01559 [Cyphellophora europaea CBS 101466]|uniref:Uncharacterized protein n=1 Tax=Cyphellophora europaea (strain CBS 101466) TaxID=1220924 RepID=W2S1F7_CYPE1|nr:uncharacterized protein HMPREF1541_01559 [Cyphellophora europaea CBS 101466]ETN42405.1 hypothetical protein HMPREF1541_01559 [Cyphellophora europaea CBS 101466]
MAEAAALIGLLAALAQFVEYGTRLATRLSDLTSESSSFAALRARLLAVLAIVQRIRKQAERGVLGVADAEVLLPVVGAVGADVRALLGVVERSIPVEKEGEGEGKESWGRRWGRAVRSLRGDKEVRRLEGRVGEGLQVLALWQTTTLVEIGVGEGRGAKMMQEGSCRTAAVLDGDDVSVASVERTAETVTLAAPANSAAPPESDPEDDDGDHLVDPEEGYHSATQSNTQLSVVSKASESSGSTGIDRCSSTCSCICHRPYSISTPAVLGVLLGRLSVTSSSRPLAPLPCSERKCLRNTTVSTRLTYRLPTWLLPIALHTTLTSTALNTTLNLNTLRVLPDSAPIFSILSRGDLPALRDHFAQGRASIHDVSTTNWTLLHTAYTLGHMPIASFLLQQGADPSIAADNGSNVVERAWFHAQKSARAPGEYVLSDNDVLRQVDADDFVAQQQYSLVHKVVLGLSALPLAEVLRGSTAEIDAGDLRGGTPLWWAAAQGNVPAVRTLLEFGADATVGGPMEQTPLHVARDARTVRALCEVESVDVDARDALGRTPLHCYCYKQMGATKALVRAAVEAGAQVNARAKGAQTPLHYAVMFGNVHLVGVLLDAGAELDAVMRDDLTPLGAAVRYDQAEAAQVLLARGASVKWRDSGKGEVLELAGRWAGVKCLDALMDALHGRHDDLGVNTREANIIWNAYKSRPLRWEELDQAFGKLLGTMGLDVDLLYQGGKHECTEEDGCSGCMPLPGAFCP